MKNGKTIRDVVIAVVLLLGVYWPAASATNHGGQGSPNADYLASAQWLQSHKHNASLVIVDVRMDEYFDGKLIPGVVRMPWRLFRYKVLERGIDGWIDAGGVPSGILPSGPWGSKT
jgi:thiosulfate/3-mercaptopyruvate sulfurtransferase